MSSTTLTIVIILAALVLAAIVVVGMRLARQKQSERLRKQYGPEYDRAMARSDNQREAEAELRDREKRHKELELRDLDQSEKEQFERRWTELQAQFVDDPSHAVQGADRLVVEVMSARGYPVDDFDQRADTLSVSHPVVTQRYREARKIATANENGTASTEDLRHAVTSYRSLVGALLEDSDSDRSDRDESRADRDRDMRDRSDADRSDADRPDTGRRDMGKGDRDTDMNGHTHKEKNGRAPDAADSFRTTEHRTER